MNIKIGGIWLFFSWNLLGCETTNIDNYDVIESVANSAKDPMVWGNAAAAMIFGFSELDEHISESARKNYYLFGSQENANRASNQLRGLTRMSMNFSSLLVDKDYQGDTWQTVGNVALRTLSDNLTAGIIATTTSDMQKWSDKPRPNDECCGAPSAHASRAFATATIAKSNYQASGFPISLQNTLIAATYLSAYATGWSRVESGWHYPSQIFAGAAYGAFLSSLIHDFTEIYLHPFKVSVDVSPKEIGLNVEFDFKHLY